MTDANVTPTSQPATVALNVAPNRVALIDAADLPLVAGLRWYLSPSGYARASCRGERKTLHRWLVETPDGVEVDHVNGDPLDNRRANLRLATRAQNAANKPRHTKRKDPAPYKGVYVSRAKSPRWVARITVCRKPLYLGLFKTPEAAARAYDVAARLHFGAFARLNFPNATEAS